MQVDIIKKDKDMPKKRPSKLQLQLNTDLIHSVAAGSSNTVAQDKLKHMDRQIPTLHILTFEKMK